MSIEARNRPLPDWFTRIRTHQLVLPRFQRFEAWEHAKVSQLFNTVLQNLPVGAALILEIGNEEPFISRTLKGAPETGDRVTEHLLDGQQRLTALWRGLHNNYAKRTYFVFFTQDEETGMPYYVDSITRWHNKNSLEIRPLWANQPKEQWKRRMIPLHLFNPDNGSQQNFKEWAKTAIEDRDERERIYDLVFNIRQQFASFNLPFLSLPVTTSKQTALDVFIKMNTSAEPLSIYDIVTAQVEAGMDKSLHDLVADTRIRCPGITNYYRPEELALSSHALLQGVAPMNSSYMRREFGPALLKNWNHYLNGVSRTVDFLEQERVFDAERLPTDVVIPVLVALWSLAPDKLDAAGSARTILRKYLWRAFFSNRYEKSTTTRAFVDFNELKPLVAGAGTSNPTIFNDELNPLPRVEELDDAGWPVRKDRLARAILALALKNGGCDLADGGAATRSNLAKREYHHLFPDAHLRSQKIPEERIYISLNCALVTWQTNRDISAKNPEKYLTERRDRNILGEAEIKARLASHLIPYDEMVANNYDKFVLARAKLIHGEMTKLCTTGGT